ncbi:hypothetical protein NLI96_g7292 [Meripilus lineatus]|uniref:Uncharacterized protein n=1 Tax=Meripilus lineatus TaxID=2056292 RepID=A0AAD5YHC4_9APHY|nr:hypothetical protein NLI96_g7292 [Physisporinus lineatus]
MAPPCNDSILDAAATTSNRVAELILAYVEKAKALFGLLDKHEAVITGELPLYILLSVFAQHPVTWQPTTIEICIPDNRYTQFLIDFGSLYTITSVRHSFAGWTNAETILIAMCNRHIEESHFVTTARSKWRLVRCERDTTDITWISKPATHELNVLTPNKIVSLCPWWTLAGKTCLYGIHREDIAAEVTSRAIDQGFIVFDDEEHLAKWNRMKNPFFHSDVTVPYPYPLEVHIEIV